MPPFSTPIRDPEPPSGSPFDVDMGGHQRSELRSEMRSISLELNHAREEKYLLDTQITVLRKLQKESRIKARVEQHTRGALQPTFSAWARAMAASRAERAQRGGRMWWMR